jgi:dynein heavy chain
VFEINTLKNATPATASRAGILYINESDVGWKPLVETWVSGRKRPTENNLSRFFEGFVEDITSLTRRGFKEVTFFSDKQSHIFDSSAGRSCPKNRR